MARDLRSSQYERLRLLIMEARQKAALSQTVVAERIGRPQSYIADIERAERRIDVIEFLTLAAVIGLDPIKAMRDLMKLSG